MVIFEGGVNFTFFSPTVRVDSNFAKIEKSQIKITIFNLGRIIDNVDFVFHEQSRVHFIFINSHVSILVFINSRLTISNW